MDRTVLDEYKMPPRFWPKAIDAVMTHKYRGSIVVLLISKSVEPNEEQKEMTSSF